MRQHVAHEQADLRVFVEQAFEQRLEQRGVHAIAREQRGVVASFGVVGPELRSKTCERFGTERFQRTRHRADVATERYARVRLAPVEPQRTWEALEQQLQSWLAQR